jgi:hypothetical protein
MYRWLPLLLSLAVGVAAGCFHSAKPKPENPPSAVETRPPDSVPQRPALGLNELLREAPTVPLEKRTFYLDDVEFAILAPLRAQLGKEAGDTRLTVGQTAGIEIKWGRQDLAAEKRWWAGGGIQGRARAFPLDSADTLVTEVDGAADDRFHFVTNVTADAYDVQMQFTKPKDIGKVMGTKADCLLMLRCARTLAVAEPLPADPEAALAKLGVRMEKGDDGRVTALRFDGAKITRPALDLLKKFPDVKDLDFRFTTARDTDFAVLKELPKLESLTFHSTFLHDDGLECLSRCAKLKKLELTWTQTTPNGLEYLKRLPELRTLLLERLKLNGPDARQLGELTQLEGLTIQYGSMDADTVKAVGNLTHLKRLAFLDAELKDEWAAPLAGLFNLETLTIRSGLGGVNNTDALLAHLKGLKKLKTLNLRGTQVTEAGVADLRKALPGTQIVVGK